MKFISITVLGLSLILLAGSANANIIDKTRDAIKNYIISHNREWEDGKIIIILKGGEKLFNKYAGRNDVEVSVPSEFEMSKVTPNLILPVSVVKDNLEIDRILVSARVEIYKDVLAANEKINKKEKITEDKLVLDTKEVSRCQAKYFLLKDKSLVVGRVAASLIPKGSIIYDWMVKIPPVISKGSKTKIIVKSDNILIETAGIALSDGQINDFIPVRRDDTREEMEAKIVSPNEVEVKI